MKTKSKINTKDRKLVFIDLEMTGLDPKKHEIADVGLLVVKPETFEIESEYEAKTIISKLERADKEALEIFGYNNEDWKDAKPLRDVLKKIASFSEEAIFVGWNMTLDWAFLEKAFHKHKVNHNFDYHKLDVFAMAYFEFHGDPTIRDISLRKTSKNLGVEIPQKHGAMVDIKATYEVFKILMERNEN